MYTSKDLEMYDNGVVTIYYIYEKCETDLDMYNFFASYCAMDEEEIKEAMRLVSGVDDAYYNALELAESYEMMWNLHL